jgi:hypothetical protein
VSLCVFVAKEFTLHLEQWKEALVIQATEELAVMVDTF